MSRLSALITYISAMPKRLFWAFVVTHLVLWTAIPSLLSPNLPLDMIEGYAWGKEWLMGTHKHPPMQAWILESLFTITGRARWVPYLASQLSIITAFWAVWQTGRRITDERTALIGVLLLEGIIYYNFTSPEFNPNVLQIPFWALIGWSFHKAVKENKAVDWILLGIWGALGMYSKYSTCLLLLMLGMCLPCHRDGRRRLLGFGPYLSLATALIVFLPHLNWLIHNHFLPLQYTQGRLERNSDHYSALVTTGLMVAGQLIALMFAMVLVIVLYDRRRSPSQPPAPSFDRVFLTFAAFGPFITMFCASLIFGYHIRDMWQTPFWNFTGLWVVVFLRPALTPVDMRRFGMMWLVVFSVGLLAFSANESLSPYVTEKPKRTIFPGKKLSQIIVDTWHVKYNTPLRYVIGDVWPAGNVAWYADDRPSVYMEGDAAISPWINQDDFKKSGGVIVWCIKCGREAPKSDDEPSFLQSTFPQGQVQPPLTLTRLTYADVPPIVMGWAIIPPE